MLGGLTILLPIFTPYLKGKDVYSCYFVIKRKIFYSNKCEQIQKKYNAQRLFSKLFDLAYTTKNIIFGLFLITCTFMEMCYSPAFITCFCGCVAQKRKCFCSCRSNIPKIKPCFYITNVVSFHFVFLCKQRQLFVLIITAIEFRTSLDFRCSTCIYSSDLISKIGWCIGSTYQSIKPQIQEQNIWCQ